MGHTYTLNEIRTAFWNQFHEAGELFFPYFSRSGDEKQNNIDVTTAAWEEFCDALQEAHARSIAELRGAQDD